MKWLSKLQTLGVLQTAKSTERRDVRKIYSLELLEQRGLLSGGGAKAAVLLPAAVDLRSLAPPIYDQGNLNSCVANSFAFAYSFQARRQGLVNPIDPSRLFIYYNARSIASRGGAVADEGTNGKPAVQGMRNFGVAPDSVWPYIAGKVNRKPSAAAYSIAPLHRVTAAKTLPNNSVVAVERSIAAGYPVELGFRVYPSLSSQFSSSTGIVKLPTKGEKSDSGHEVSAVGYNASGRYFIVANSWSTGYGQNGYYFLPFAYIRSPKLSSEFISLRRVT